MDAFTVRRYRPTDAAAVWDVHQRDLSDAMPLFSPAWATDLHDVERAYLRDGDFLVAVDGSGDVVAIGGITPETDETVRMTRVRVLPDYLGSGVFNRLVAELERLARMREYDCLTLDSNGHLDVRNSALDTLGYELVKEEPLPEWSTNIRYYEKCLD